MLEPLAIIVLFIGLIGMSVIILRKIPVLAKLQTQETENLKILETIKGKIKAVKGNSSFSGNILLQKMLSKIRVLILRTDSKTSAWLVNLRQKSLKNKKNFSDDYWEKIKRK